MSKEKQSQSISVRELFGKQIIDNKGSLLGVLKDLKLSSGKSEIEVLVELKTGTITKFLWSDIQSVEDFILLKKSVRVKTDSKKESVERIEKTEEVIIEPTTVPAQEVTCPNCNSKLPGNAKFCRKCGKKVIE